MATFQPTSKIPTTESKDALTVQWQAAMDRLKHHEALTITGLGLNFAGAAYSVREVLASAHPTPRDYWAVVFVLTVLCVCQAHGVDRVNDTAAGVIELEIASQGKLTYLSRVAQRVTWTATFGFLAIFVAPVVSLLCIAFEYRDLAADRTLPFVFLGVSGLVFVLFAFGIMCSQRNIMARVKPAKVQ
jgi:hypothetical protein